MTLTLRNDVVGFWWGIWEGSQCHHQTALVGGHAAGADMCTYVCLTCVCLACARQAGHTVTSGPLALNHDQQARQRRFVMTTSSRLFR
jgi:hypothetical protein